MFKKKDHIEGTRLVEVDASDNASVLEHVEDTEDLEEAQKTFGRKVPKWVKLVVILALIVAFLISFALGRYGLSPADIVQAIINHFTIPLDQMTQSQAFADAALFEGRGPRIIICMLVGAGLSVAGGSYQGMFKNPLVSPDILGASAGASLGACLALLFDMPNEMVQLFAFLGGLAAVGSAVWITKTVKYDAILGLILGGILVSTLFQSGTSLVKLVADGDDKLPSITFWLMGSFNSTTKEDLLMIILPMVAGFVIILLQSWKLNVLSFGDEEARSMGINTKRVRLLVILASTLLASTSVAVSGIIGWVGLVIPHLARAIVGPNYKVLLPTSMALGAAFLLLVDDISRLVFAFEIPIGILTSILGVPFFIFIFKRNMKGWK